MLINILKIDFEFNDDRGSLVQLVHEGYKQVNYIISKGGIVRGNHYHRYNTEAFYVIRGKFKLKVQAIIDGIASPDIEEHIFESGDIFSIPAYINHSFEYIEDTELISMYSDGVERPDGSKDLWNL